MPFCQGLASQFYTNGQSCGYGRCVLLNKKTTKRTDGKRQKLPSSAMMISIKIVPLIIRYDQNFARCAHKSETNESTFTLALITQQVASFGKAVKNFPVN